MSKKFRYALYVLFACVLLLALGSIALQNHDRRSVAPSSAMTQVIYEDTSADAESESVSGEAQQQASVSYVLNTNTMRFHLPSCRDVPKIAAKNYAASSQPRSEIISRGYSPCGHCNP